MFTGLIEDVGRVASWQLHKASGRMTIRTKLASREMPLGCSIAVNGACLTVVSKAHGSFAADVSPETLRRTNLSDLDPGDRVNLELPLRLGERLGGHLVTGHVDGVARVVAIRPAGDFTLFRFDAPASLIPLLVPKGSVAVDGISLTVNGCRGKQFSVMIIPFTLKHSNLHSRRLGDKVNLEVDILGKYVKQLLVPRTRKASRGF